MFLEYLYVVESNEKFIKNKEFNFSNKYDFKCSIEGNKFALEVFEKRNKVEFQYAKNIKNMTAIVGKNGSGKSSLIRAIIKPNIYGVYIYSKETKVHNIDEFYYVSRDYTPNENKARILNKSIDIKKLESDNCVNMFFYTNDIFSEKTKNTDAYKDVIKLFNHSPRAILDDILHLTISNGVNIKRKQYSPSLSNDIEKVEIIQDALRLNFLASIGNKNFVKTVFSEIQGINDVLIIVTLNYNYFKEKFEEELKYNYDIDPYENETINRLDKHIGSLKSKYSKYKSIEAYKEYLIVCCIISYSFLMLHKELLSINRTKSPNWEKEFLAKCDKLVIDLNEDEEKIVSNLKKKSTNILFEYKDLIKKMEEVISEIRFEFTEVTQEKLRKGFYDNSDENPVIICDLKLNLKKIQELLLYLGNFNIYGSFQYRLFNVLTESILELSTGETSFLNLLASMNHLIFPLPCYRSNCYVVLESLDKSSDSLIIILDEPDCNMHPEWIRKWTNNFIEYLSENFIDIKCQIIMTTNNPIFLSDIPKENIIAMSREDNTGKVIDKAQTFGQNILTIMKEQFFVDNTYGEFSIKYMQAISAFLNEQLYDKNSYKDIIKAFNNCFDKYNITVSNKNEIVNKLSSMISSVGEPIIKNHFINLLAELKIKILTKEEQIEILEQEILKLKEGE